MNLFYSVILMILIISAIARLVFVLPERADKDDFAHYYIATKIYLSGGNPYKVDLAPLYEKYGFTLELNQKVISPYPPIFFALLAPFVIFQPSSAFIGWTVFQFICLIYILLMIKYLARGYLSIFSWLFFSMLIISSSFVYYHFYYSQIALFLVALVISAYALSNAKHRHVANLLITIAGLIKIYPFILLPWFIFWNSKNKVRIRFSDFLYIFGFILIILTITGWDLWFAFVEQTLNNSVGGSFSIFYNYSLPSFIINYAYAFLSYMPHLTKNFMIIPCGLFAGLFILIFSYFYSLKYPKSKSDGFCLMIIAMLLAFPRVLGHYYVFLIFPLAMAFIKQIASPEKKRIPIIWIFLSYIILNLHHLPFFILPYFQKELGILTVLFLNYFPFYGLTGLYIYYLFQIKKNSKLSSDEFNSFCSKNNHSQQ